MGVTLSFHILAGMLGILSGFIALYSAKGAPLHRKAGMVFVAVMLPMAITGMVIAAVRNVAPAINIPAGTLTFYLVVTGLTTIRPAFYGSRWLDIGALLLAVTVCIATFWLGFGAIAAGGKETGLAFPSFMFAVVSLLASVGDIRMIRSGALKGARRLARHLWRMSFALFIAALSLFFGQAQVFPEPIRNRGLLALPIFAVLATMGYWLWRVRFRQSLRGLVTRAPSARADELSANLQPGRY